MARLQTRLAELGAHGNTAFLNHSLSCLGKQSNSLKPVQNHHIMQRMKTTLMHLVIEYQPYRDIYLKFSL
tara:strand:+ start:82 stop:291 length:210 start_codon:yes stop_codon:yes gene_type:complete